MGLDHRILKRLVMNNLCQQAKYLFFSKTKILRFVSIDKLPRFRSEAKLHSLNGAATRADTFTRLMSYWFIMEN